ncbi:Y-family DNA polymerase [Brevundimonas pishanensis]|uniref:Y-family DNA polymerase n=1 Tax=Brevundimonas pishanensis TaxID=2896315 RepID=UPI001FA6D87B
MPDADVPLACVAKQSNALRLTAVNRAAIAAGLASGMTLADAHARVPELTTVPSEPRADEELMARLVDGFGRFSPMVARDNPHGLMLDITGCAHLFGGEDGMMAAVRRLAGRARLQVRLAIALTPHSARALVRFGSEGAVSDADIVTTAGRLPVEAFERPASEITALKRAGLKRLADVDARPRAAMAARFGEDFCHVLDRTIGRIDIRITPVRLPAPIVADRRLAEPILHLDPVEGIIADLLADTEQQMEQTAQGGRAFTLTVFRLDGWTRRVTVRTGRAMRQVAPLMRLFHERLQALDTPIDPGFGLDQFRMEVDDLVTLAAQQVRLDEPARRGESLEDLTDRLSTRLGAQAVMRVKSTGSHLPERACVLRPALHPARADEGDDWPELKRDGLERPMTLFNPPQPIEAIALAPDSPPARFVWRRVTRRIIRAEGPERIEGEWWRRPRHRVRDYYRVEDETGHRYWLFRAGHYGEEPAPRWYVHGLFA